MQQSHITNRNNHHGFFLIPLALLGIMLVFFLNPIILPPVHAKDQTGGIEQKEGRVASSRSTSNLPLTIALSIENSVLKSTASKELNGGFSVASTPVHISIKDSNGFSVFLSSKTNTLIGSLASNATTIPSIDKATSSKDFQDNTWGYSFSEGKGIIAEELTYQPIPLTSTTPILISTLDSAELDYSLSFAAKFAETVPADTYAGSVTLSLVANPKQVALDLLGMAELDWPMQKMTAEICAASAIEDTVRLRDSRDNTYYWVARLADGNCWMTQNLSLDLEKGVAVEGSRLNPATGRYEAYSYIPEETTRTPATPERFTIIDPSTGEVGDYKYLNENAIYSWNEGRYVIIYPEDGSLGLRFGVKAGQGTAEGGLGGLTNKTEILTACALSSSSQEYCDELKSSPILTDYGIVLDVSEPDWQITNDLDFTAIGGEYTAPDGRTCVKTSGWSVDPVCKVYDSHYMFGNYYQWLTANAFTAEEKQNIVAIGQKTGSSICPAGWQLPYSGNYTGLGYNDMPGSFFNLVRAYAENALDISGTVGSNANMNDGYSSITSKITKGEYAGKTIKQIFTGQPMYFYFAGNVAPLAEHQQVRFTGASGPYWSQVRAGGGNSYARYIDSDPNNIAPSSNNPWMRGFSVRCLLIVE